MKNQLIKIAALAFVMLFSIASFAGNKGGKMDAAQKAELRMQKINEVCNLSVQQQAEVKQLFLQQMESRENKENKQVHKVNTTDRQPLMAARIAKNKQFQSSMKQILSAGQQTKWQAFKQAQKAERPTSVKK